MLTRTFIHLPGVGPRSEAHFWREGLHTWEDFLAAGEVRGLGSDRYALLRRAVQESLAQADNPAYFARLLPAGELWRLFRVFKARACYLDIETTGMSWPQEVTVIGLYDGDTFQQFVQGQNLADFEEAIQPFDLIVTFNGLQFDVPVLRACFRGLNFPAVHLDLRFILARLGFKGGLKRIEPHFGIERPPEVADLDGWEAVLLWERHRRGDRTALNTLLKYNREDVINLKTLMTKAFHLAQERLLAG